MQHGHIPEEYITSEKRVTFQFFLISSRISSFNVSLASLQRPDSLTTKFSTSAIMIGCTPLLTSGPSEDTHRYQGANPRWSHSVTHAINSHSEQHILHSEHFRQCGKPTGDTKLRRLRTTRIGLLFNTPRTAPSDIEHINKALASSSDRQPPFLISNRSQSYAAHLQRMSRSLGRVGDDRTLRNR